MFVCRNIYNDKIIKTEVIHANFFDLEIIYIEIHLENFHECIY